MSLKKIPADQYRELFENSLDAVLVIVPEGTLEAANGAACEMLGLTETEVCARRREHLVDVTDPRLWEFLEERRRMGRARGEFRMKRKNGDIFEADVTSVVLDEGKRAFLIIRDVTKMKRTEESLRESEQQRARTHRELQAIIDGAPATAIFVKDLEGRYVTVNRSVESLLGASRDLIRGKTDFELFPPDHAKLYREYDRQVLAEGKPMQFEETAVSGTGVEHVFLTSKFPLWDEVGMPYAICGISVDITKMKQGEQELARLSEQRQLALDSANMGWWHHDPVTGITRHDKRYREIFGVNDTERPLEEFIGRLHPEDAPFVRAKIKAALDPADPQRYVAEYRIVLDSGELRWVESHGSASFEGEGDGRRAVSLVGTVQDITDRKLAESLIREAYERAEKLVRERTGELSQAVENLSDEVEQRSEAEAVLRKSEAMLKTVLETLPVGVGIVSQSDGVTFMNPAAKNIWHGRGYVPDGETRRYRAWWHETGAPLELEEWGAAQSVLYGREVVGQILDIEALDGAKKVVTCSSAPIRDAEDAVIGAVAVTEDITSQIELQKQLLHSQKLESLGALAGGVAHDFNNLLTAICGYTELVYDDLYDHRLRENLRHVLVAGEKARELTQKILAFSRQQVTETRVISLSAAVRDIMKLLPRMLREDIEVRSELSDLPLCIRGNESQIEQVLMNVIVNAQDAMPGRGVLTIATGTIPDPSGETAGSGFVRIGDTGGGIPGQHLDRIFDPYFTTKETGKGTGLGLSLSYGIVSQHQGRIVVESAEGKGASFTVSFPLTQEEECRTTTAAATPRTGSETVLVVEDDEPVRTYLKSTLARGGYKVLVAATGEEALRVAAEHPADIVVSDVIMPKMNGIEMFAQMEKIRPGVKVVFVSGYSSDILDSQGIDTKRSRFLQKPLSRNLLLRTVREMLDKKQ